MEWLKLNYDRAILAAAAVALGVCSWLIVSSAQDFPNVFAERSAAKPKNNTIKPLPVEAITKAAATVKEPAQWATHEGSLLVSRPYVLKGKDLIDPLAEGTPLHDPIPNSWLIQNDLPYWEIDVKEQDPDQDRFSNLEEFTAGTNPKDPKSVPPYYTKLRLEKFISVPFRLIFTGSPDDGQTFTINTKDRGGRTQFLALGDTIQGTPYKLLTYNHKVETKDDMEVDNSELTIENTETKQKIILVVKKEANDPTSFGEFVNLYDGSKFKVKKDDDFTLNPELERKYKLIDISEGEALIKDLQSGSQYKIPKI